MADRRDRWVKIELPPGLRRNGTEYQNAGGFYDANLVRWYEGMMRPVGGWVQRSDGTVLGKARAILTWVDNSNVARAAIGTHSKMYVMADDGTLSDVTPTAYTAQDADTSTWVFDTAGETLFGVNDGEGDIYRWDPGDTEAAALSNAPTALGLVVTDQRILVALGAAGDPRRVDWSDAEGYTTWTPTATNFAGSLNIQTPGELQAGAVVRGGTLLFTTEDLHILRYRGLPDTYGQERVAGECGTISRKAHVVLNSSTAIWMGRQSFYLYNGYVKELPCAIYDDVFGDLNEAQAHKVRAIHIGAFNEIWWVYPTTGSENARVAVYNYAEGHWSHHGLVRLCGINRGNGFDYPLLVDADGKVWDHERGTTKTGGGTVYAKTAPLEIATGERVMEATLLVPDEGAAGDVDVYFHSRFYPNGTETTHGPYASANPTGVRFEGRQAAMEFREAEANDWRVGHYRVQVKQRGYR